LAAAPPLPQQFLGKAGQSGQAAELVDDPEARLAKAVDAIRKKKFTAERIKALEVALKDATPGKPSLLPAIDDKLPITAVFTIAELEQGRSVGEHLGLKVQLTCSPPAAARGEEPAYREGILMPAERSCTATATQGAGELGRIHFAAADSSAPSVLPVPRQAFVKSTSIYTFDGGRLAKTETVRPSPVLSGVAVPGRAIGAFFGGIVAGVTGRKDAAEAESARVDAEIKRLTKARELEDLRKKQKADQGADAQQGEAQ
jgi:hypothetical protein